MKSLRWMLTLAVLLAWSAASFADSTPPDGGAGVKGGSDPTAITGPVQTISFSPCNTTPTPAGCPSTSSMDAVFAGENETGYAWSTVELILNFSSPTTSADDYLSCTGDGLFTAFGGACNEDIPLGTTSLTLYFFQGTGSGISCTDGNYSTSNPNLLNDLNCLNNSNAAQATGGVPYEYYTDGACPAGINPGAVCGPSTFLITLTSWTDLPLSGVLITPEPSTFQLLGVGALLAALALGIKKARLAHS